MDDVGPEQAGDLLLAQDRDTSLLAGPAQPKMPGLEDGSDPLFRLLEGSSNPGASAGLQGLDLG